MDLRKLKTLIDLVSESNISELEITEADGKVRIFATRSEIFWPSSIPPPPGLAPWPTTISIASALRIWSGSMP